MKFDKALLIKNLTAQTEKQAKVIIDDVLNQVVDSLMELSPVGQPDEWVSTPPKDYEPGKYKANWQHGFNEAKTSVLDMRDESDMMEKDSSTSKYLKKEIKANKTIIGTHYFTNNVSYAEAVEYGANEERPWQSIHNPQSQHKPHAVAGLTAQNIPSFIAKAQSRVKK